MGVIFPYGVMTNGIKSQRSLDRLEQFILFLRSSELDRATLASMAAPLLEDYRRSLREDREDREAMAERQHEIHEPPRPHKPEALHSSRSEIHSTTTASTSEIHSTATTDSIKIMTKIQDNVEIRAPPESPKPEAPRSRVSNPIATDPIEQLPVEEKIHAPPRPPKLEALHRGSSTPQPPQVYIRQPMPPPRPKIPTKAPWPPPPDPVAVVATPPPQPPPLPHNQLPPQLSAIRPPAPRRLQFARWRGRPRRGRLRRPRRGAPPILLRPHRHLCADGHGARRTFWRGRSRGVRLHRGARHAAAQGRPPPQSPAVCVSGSAPHPSAARHRFQVANHRKALMAKGEGARTRPILIRLQGEGHRPHCHLPPRLFPCIRTGRACNGVSASSSLFPVPVTKEMGAAILAIPSNTSLGRTWCSSKCVREIVEPAHCIQKLPVGDQFEVMVHLVYFKLMNTVAVDVKCSDVVDQIKSKIGAIEGIDKSQHTLFFAGNQLEDYSMLFDYSILANSSVNLSVPDGMQITVSVPSVGKMIKLNVRKSQSVVDVKAVIKKKGKIPSDEQMLMHAGRQLEDHQMLSQYSLSDGQTLHVQVFPNAKLLISIDVYGERTRDLDIQSWYTVADVKLMLENLEGLPAGKKILGCSQLGCVVAVEDTETLQNLHVRNNGILMSYQNLQFFIRTCQGKSLTMSMKTCDTTDEVMKKN